METNRLIQFCVVVETGNLRKAAQILKMTHGALSKSLKVLEGQLNTELFQHVGRGLKVTDDGMRVYGKSKQISQLIRDLAVTAPSAHERLIRFGTFEVFSTYFLSKLLGEYLE